MTCTKINDISTKDNIPNGSANEHSTDSLINKIFSFCLLPVEDLDGQANKCVYICSVDT